MKSEMLRLVKCLECGEEASFGAEVTELRGDEIWEGAAVCDGCASRYAITAGVIDLMTAPSSVVSNERASYRDSRDEILASMRSLNDVERENGLLRIALMEHTGTEFRLTSDVNLQQALKSVSPSKGQWLLELGAGSGWLTARWAQAGLSCIATDISVDLKLELSPLVMNHEGVYFDRALADMTRLPFGDGRIDFVFVSASLHHAESLHMGLREASRVLKPDGKLVAINEPMHGLVRRSGKRFVDQAALENPGIHEQSFSYFTWKSALRAASLTPRFLFPAYYQTVLEGQGGEPIGSRRLVKIAARVWRSRLRYFMVSPLMFRVIQVLFGVNVCMIARKKQPGER